MSEVVYTGQVPITRSQLESFIRVINISTNQPLTIEEVLANERLLQYICFEAINDGVALHDPTEFWNNDGWCDVEQYR